MSKLLCCTVVVLTLITFINVEAATGNSAPETRELIVIEPIEQAGQEKPERRGVLKDVNIKQLVDIDTQQMIDVTDMPQTDAIDAITAAGLKVANIRYEYSDNVPAGIVISQEPPAGTMVETNSAIKLIIAQTEIAIQSFPIRRNIGGEVEGKGQLIVHRLFDVELKKPIQNIPIFAISYPGLRHATTEARAESIAENLLMAWGVLAEGGYLETAPDKWVMPDDEEKWRLRGPFAPDYKNKSQSFPAIYVRHKSFAKTPIRIMTVYPEDAKLFGQPADETGMPSLFTEQELAEYLVSLIQANYLMLAKRDGQIEDFEKLEICKTREGTIFKEIYLRALEEAKVTDTNVTNITNLRSALARVALSQRYRLLTLAFNAPRDWRFRNEEKL